MFCSFVLKQKNQKFKNAGSPPGGIQPSAPGWLPCKRPFMADLHSGYLFLLNASFITYFLAFVIMEFEGPQDS